MYQTETFLPRSRPSLFHSLIAEISTQLDPDAARQRSAAAVDYRGPDGIVRFAREVLRVEPADYQAEILQAFVERRRVAVRGPHGIGKTFISACIVLWCMAAFDTDVKVVTTASAWRQLAKYTWPEIRKWGQRADWGKVGLDIRRGRELLDLSLRLNDKEAFAVASDNPALIEGAHASKIIYVFDEAKAIPVDTWDAAEGAFSTGDAFALAISTPGDPSGRFYDIHSRKPGYEDWWTRHVTLDEAIAAGRINPDWVAQRRAQWGETSAVYQNRVLGEFAASGEDSVIPLAWVELANERWRAAEGKGTGRVSWGLDVAYKGEDKSVLARLVGNVAETFTAWAKQDTMQTVGRVVMAVDKRDSIGVDVIGVGAGVFDRLREQGYSATGINVGEGTGVMDKSGRIGFINLRAALWWALREALDPEGDTKLAIPPIDELTGDLTAPLWSVTSGGKIKVESKDDIRARIGRSTDYADALALAWWGGRFSGVNIRFG